MNEQITLYFTAKINTSNTKSAQLFGFSVIYTLSLFLWIYLCMVKNIELIYTKIMVVSIYDHIISWVRFVFNKYQLLSTKKCTSPWVHCVFINDHWAIKNTYFLAFNVYLEPSVSLHFAHYSFNCLYMLKSLFFGLTMYILFLESLWSCSLSLVFSYFVKP